MVSHLEMFAGGLPPHLVEKSEKYKEQERLRKAEELEKAKEAEKRAKFLENFKGTSLENKEIVNASAEEIIQALNKGEVTVEQVENIVNTLFWSKRKVDAGAREIWWVGSSDDERKIVRLLVGLVLRGGVSSFADTFDSFHGLDNEDEYKKRWFDEVINKIISEELNFVLLKEIFNGMNKKGGTRLLDWFVKNLMVVAKEKSVSVEVLQQINNALEESEGGKQNMQRKDLISRRNSILEMDRSRLRKYPLEQRPYLLELHATLLASRLHESWASGIRSKGVTERLKNTTDEVWKKNNKSEKVDILNTEFSDLPNDWKKENYLSAESAMKSIYLGLDSYTLLDDQIESIADSVHKAWIERRKAEGFNKARYDFLASIGNKSLLPKENQEYLEKWGWARPLMEDYGNLPEDEKQKDRDVVKAAIEVFRKPL